MEKQKKIMKIGIAAPLSLASVNGGVRTQVLQTAHHLRLLNVDLEFIQFKSRVQNVVISKWPSVPEGAMAIVQTNKRTDGQNQF